MADEEQDIKRDKLLKKYNRILAGLIVFSVIYAIWIFFYIEQAKQSLIEAKGIIMVDPVSGKFRNLPSSNLLTNLQFSNSTLPETIIDIGKGHRVNLSTNYTFKQKNSYDVMDIVTVNYFFINGIITKKDNNDCTVLYMDNDGIMQSIIVPQQLLISPSFDKGMDPFFLLR